MGWTNAGPITFALVDYAGLADKYIKAQRGHSLGTKVNGFVIECKLPNGKRQITVTLLTTRALGFAQSIADIENSGFAAPTIFGAKAFDVKNVSDAAVGPAILLTTFSIKPDAKLPDFLDVVNNPADYAPVKLNFTSTTFGKCADGTKARLDVHEVASTNDQNALVYSTEKVEIVDDNGGDCLLR